MMTKLKVLVLVGISIFGSMLQAQETAKRGLYLILDASWSMAEPFSTDTKQEKFDAARQTLAKVVSEVPPDYELALRVFGGPCTYGELVVPFAPSSESRGWILEEAGTIEPDGETPIKRSLEKAIQDFGNRPGEIILISDGIDTCDGWKAPCDLLKDQAKKNGPRIRIHVVGLALSLAQRSAMQCISDLSGTTFRDALSPDQLDTKLKEAFQDAEKGISSPPPTEPQPEDSPPKTPSLVIQIFACFVVLIAILWIFWELRRKIGWSVILACWCVVVLVGLLGWYPETALALVACGLGLAVVISMALVGFPGRDPWILVTALSILAIIILLVGFTDVGPWDFPAYLLLLCLALLAICWVAGIEAAGSPFWLRGPRLWGLLVLGAAALALVVIVNVLNLEAALPRPDGWTIALTAALVLSISFALSVFSRWREQVSHSLDALACAVWLLAGGFFLLFEVTLSWQWALPLVAVGVIFQGLRLALHFRRVRWGRAWTSDQLGKGLRWGSWGLTGLLLVTLLNSAANEMHLVLLAIYLTVHLAWEGWRPGRLVDLELFFLLVVFGSVAFFSPGLGGIISKWPVLNFAPILILLLVVLILRLLEVDSGILGRLRRWCLRPSVSMGTLASILLVAVLLDGFSRPLSSTWFCGVLLFVILLAAWRVRSSWLFAGFILVLIVRWSLVVALGLTYWLPLGLVGLLLIISFANWLSTGQLVQDAENRGGGQTSQPAVVSPTPQNEVVHYALIPYRSIVLRATQTTPKELESEFRLLLAVKLVETRRLSIDLAAEIAGIPKPKFLENLKHLRSAE